MYLNLSAISKICLSTLTLILLPLSFTPDKIMAQTINFRPPSGAAPKTTTGAATRDSSCLIDSSRTDQKFSQTLPILPKSNYGLTFSERPAFPIFKTKTSAKQVFLSLESEDGENVYQNFLPLTTEVGFITINFPQDAPNLVINKKYKWTMAFICGKMLKPDSPSISGWIQQVPKSQSLSAKLKSASPVDRIAVYGENGIWYDMINELNQLKKQNPSNQTLSSAWDKLIKDHVVQQTKSVTQNK
jgi:hypothetical protein